MFNSASDSFSVNAFPIACSSQSSLLFLLSASSFSPLSVNRTLTFLRSDRSDRLSTSPSFQAV